MREETGKIAQELKPEMQKVKLDITPKSLRKKKVVKELDKFETFEEFSDEFVQGKLSADTVELLELEFGAEIFDDPKLLKNAFENIKKPKIVEQIGSTWDKLKIKQAKDPAFVGFVGSKRMQQNFQEFIDKILKTKKDLTLDDLWQMRIDYDNTIKSSVKKANDLSPEGLQLQREMWLENRRILNDVINDTASGLGDVSKQSFADMSDLYMANQNIASKAKIDVKGVPGVLSREQIIKRTVGGVAGTLIIGAAEGAAIVLF